MWMAALHVRPSGADLIVIDLGPPGPRLSRSRRTRTPPPPPLPTNKQECGVFLYRHAQIWRGALSSTLIISTGITFTSSIYPH